MVDESASSLAVAKAGSNKHIMALLLLSTMPHHHLNNIDKTQPSTPTKIEKAERY